jgi:hypothetical protein
MKLINTSDIYLLIRKEYYVVQYHLISVVLGGNKYFIVKYSKQKMVIRFMFRTLIQTAQDVV